MFLALKPKLFAEKKNAQNHRQGTYSAKMGAVVWPKISPTMSAQAKKVWDFHKKTLSWCP